MIVLIHHPGFINSTRCFLELVWNEMYKFYGGHALHKVKDTFIRHRPAAAAGRVDTSQGVCYGPRQIPRRSPSHNLKIIKQFIRLYNAGLCVVISSQACRDQSPGPLKISREEYWEEGS